MTPRQFWLIADAKKLERDAIKQAAGGKKVMSKKDVLRHVDRIEEFNKAHG